MCVSFKARDSMVEHNVVYMAVRGQGPWASFKGWVTIHSEPWLTDPEELMEQNMMWESFEALEATIPELGTQPLPPKVFLPVNTPSSLPLSVSFLCTCVYLYMSVRIVQGRYPCLIVFVLQSSAWTGGSLEALGATAQACVQTAWRTTKGS